MQRVRQRQLELAFADNPPRGGGGQAKASGIPDAKAWLRQIAKAKESECLTAGVTDTTRLTGWEAYFDLCTRPQASRWPHYDAHVRRRLRTIIVHQRKRPRFLHRHLKRRGVSKGTAAMTAWSRQGKWAKGNMRGMHRAYPNAWFAERLVSVWDLWQKRHPLRPTQPASDGQQWLLALG